MSGDPAAVEKLYIYVTAEKLLKQICAGLYNLAENAHFFPRNIG
jgi:hypothetical protein